MRFILLAPCILLVACYGSAPIEGDEAPLVIEAEPLLVTDARASLMTESSIEAAAIDAPIEADPLGPWAGACQGAPVGTGVGCFGDRVIICEANGPALAPPCQTFQQCTLDTQTGNFGCENRPCDPPSFCGYDRDSGRPTAYQCYTVEQTPGWNERTCAPNETCQLNENQVAGCVPAPCDPQLPSFQCVEETQYKVCDPATNTMTVASCAEGTSCGRRGIPMEAACYTNGAVDCSLQANASAAWCNDISSMVFYCEGGQKKSKNCYNFSCGWANQTATGYDHWCLEQDPE